MKGINKVKICISLDIDTYEELQRLCKAADAKISTKINTIVSNSLKKADKKRGEG